MPTLSTYQPNSAVDVKIRRATSQGKTPSEVTTLTDCDVSLIVGDNSVNGGAKTYLKFWNKATTPNQDTEAPDMILPCGPGQTFSAAVPDGLIGGIWSAGIFWCATATKESANTSAATQSDPSVLITTMVGHGV